MVFALSSISIQCGWVLSAHKASAFSGALIRADGWQGAFITAANAVFTLGVDSPSARTTKGEAMFHSPKASAAQCGASALPFPAPLQGMESACMHGVSVRRAAASLGGTPGVGSFPLTLQAGNSSPVECVGSEAGSY